MAFGDILNTPATDSVSSNFANTITVTLAATPTSGNAIVACYSTAATTATADDMKPTGFAVASEATNTAINRKVVQYLKISDGTETAVTCGGGDAYAGEVVVYVVDVGGNATPLGDVGANSPSTATDTDPILCGSVTTTEAEALVIATATHTLGSGGVATPSTGFTLGATVQGSGSGSATTHKLLSATGTESPTVSMAGGVSDNAGCSLSLYSGAAPLPEVTDLDTDEIIYKGQGSFTATVTGVPETVHSWGFRFDASGEEATAVSRSGDVFTLGITAAIQALPDSESLAGTFWFRPHDYVAP